jgi:hypothetical protein
MKKTFLIFLFAITMTIASFAQPVGGVSVSNKDIDDCLSNYSYVSFDVYHAQATYYEARDAGATAGVIQYLTDETEENVNYRFSHSGDDYPGYARIEVRACNGSGCSSTWTLVNDVLHAYPIASNTPSGESAPVQGVWEDYTVPTIVGSTGGYEWQITGGYFFAEGSGGSPYSSGTIIDTSNPDIDLKFVSPPYTTFYIKVRGVSDECGDGTWSSSKSVTVAIP